MSIMQQYEHLPKPKKNNMKQLLFLLLLAAITTTAYADKNHKAEAKNKTIKPKLPQQEQTVMPANNPASNDTAWQGTGKENAYLVLPDFPQGIRKR